MLSFVGSPTYESVKWLSLKRKNHYKDKFTYSLNNNLDLLNKFFPVLEVLSLIELDLHNSDFPQTYNNEVIKLLRACLDQNFFAVNKLTSNIKLTSWTCKR